MYNVRAPLNYRGTYPYSPTLEINPMFGSNNLVEYAHYLFNLVLPGKAQSSFYTNSFINKIRSIIVGLGAYYLAYQTLSNYDNYDIYNSEYNKYLDLYNDATNPEDIILYKDKVLNNQNLSNKYREETLKFALASGLLFGVNAIEVTLLHLEF